MENGSRCIIGVHLTWPYCILAIRVHTSSYIDRHICIYYTLCKLTCPPLALFDRYLVPCPPAAPRLHRENLECPSHHPPSLSPSSSTAAMSSKEPQPNEAEKNIEIWKVKKLIKRLEAARGNGTSMISLIIRMCRPRPHQTPDAEPGP